MHSEADLRTFQDAFDLLCGDKIGAGIHRTVYKCRLRPDLVVKVELSEDWRNFANVKECEFWDKHQHAQQIAKWLAPCEYMSPDGRILLQKKAIRIPCNVKLPERMPSFLTDFKRENYGFIDGRLVCVDYAITVPAPSLRMKKADWGGT